MAELRSLDAFLAQCEERGDSLAYLDEEGMYSFAALAQRARQWAEELAQDGVMPGDVVAISGDFSFENLACFLGAALRGCCVAPLATSVEHERADRLREGRVQWVMYAGTVTTCPPLAPHPLLEKLRTMGHAGLVIFSSGTTGKPKAMLHDLDQLIAGYALKPFRDLRLLLLMHFDHIGGIDVFLRGFASGVTLVKPASRQPEAVARAIAAHQVHVLSASPTLLNLLLVAGVADRHDFSSLRLITYGAEAMPAALLARLRARFPGIEMQQRFGTSETHTVRVVSRNNDSLEMRIEDAEVSWRIEAGELLLKTPRRILGYLNRDVDAALAGDWFHTGDLVEESADGWLRIIGRKQEVINVGGEKVLPSEVEGILLEMSAIAECRVFGQPHPLTGAIVCVEVVPRIEEDPVALRRAVRQFCHARLESYKVPAKVKVVAQVRMAHGLKKARA